MKIIRFLIILAICFGLGYIDGKYGILESYIPDSWPWWTQYVAILIIAAIINQIIQELFPISETESVDNDDAEQKPLNKNNTWRGNGSGFFISTSGHIVTNYHVINNAREIGVEFRYKNEMVTFNAEITKQDEKNDLAILKLKDSNFSGLDKIPFNIQTKPLNLGAKVYVLGYPAALSGMGKDIKFTDGKVSAKTGYNEDIRVYQTTAPVQPGNSGGPLFDFSGNLIGINSSKIISKDIEGVSYSIKASYLYNLIDVMREKIPMPSDTSLKKMNLEEQIKTLSDYVVLIKIN